ncbi:MAG: OmpA family protein [Myxococcales bacterium]|nr:OmpA family protein [Myxococcales bacterium]
MHAEEDDSLPIWPAFGDLMACLFGIFVLFFCWMVLMEVSLTAELRQAEAEKAATEERLDRLERVLAGPLASGLITLTDGRIGIRGSVLFDLSSAELRGEGRRLLRELAGPLHGYLAERREALMVSGFTDDLAVRPNSPFADNWELSAQRSLTVTRELVAAGMPPEWVFAAGFGHHHPAVPNDSDDNRQLNRRVEIAPVPRPMLARLTGGVDDLDDVGEQALGEPLGERADAPNGDANAPNGDANPPSAEEGRDD